jgi:tRNA (Thr-GGU) A37 N-methylase
MFFFQYLLVVLICIIIYFLWQRKKQQLIDITQKLRHQGREQDCCLILKTRKKFFFSYFSVVFIVSFILNIELLRQQERSGRINAEKQLAEIHRRLNSQSSEFSVEAKNNNKIKTTTFRVIGTLESCFKERNGTPRQGKLVPDSRARLKLFSWTNGIASLDGLSQFSHVWIIFIFHANTNDHKLGNIDQLGVNPKIRPPRLNGAKVGLFATRTPHRANNIGLSLVQLDRVEKVLTF